MLECKSPIASHNYDVKFAGRNQASDVLRLSCPAAYNLSAADVMYQCYVGLESLVVTVHV